MKGEVEMCASCLESSNRVAMRIVFWMRNSIIERLLDLLHTKMCVINIAYDLTSVNS